MWAYYNPNPLARNVDDCAIRALCVVLNVDWERAFYILADAACSMGDVPVSISVFSAVMRSNGFYRKAISSKCPDCFTAEDFAIENPKGTYVLCSDRHVVALEKGILYDTSDPSDMIPQFYWYRKTGGTYAD